MRLNVGRRGLWRLAPSRLRLRDALGIFERSMLAGQPEQVLILPAPDPAMPIPARPASCAAPGEADLDGLEPYVPGSPIGRIHWPALARGAGLQQRRLPGLAARRPQRDDRHRGGRDLGSRAPPPGPAGAGGPGRRATTDDGREGAPGAHPRRLRAHRGAGGAATAIATWRGRRPGWAGP